MTSASSDTANRYLEGDYLAANPGWHEEDAAWKVDQIARLMARNSIRVESYCDIGCGTGLCTALMRRVFPAARADGFEFSPQAYARAQERTAEGLRFHNHSPFEGEERFDLAVALDVVEHVENPFDFVRGMARIGRHVLLHIPLDMNGLAVLREWPILAARRDVGHLSYFTRGTALALLRDCGLEIVDELYTPWAIDQSDKSWKKRVAALPRRLLFSLAPHGTVRAIGGWSLLVLARPKAAPAS